MKTKRPISAKKYEEIKQVEMAVNFIANNVIPKIPENIRPFFRLKYCIGTKLDRQTLDALVKAILIFSSHVNVSKKCTIFIGNSFFRFNIEPCGSFSYKQKQEFMATTINDHNIIFLNFHILSQVSPEVCIASILEEFVHAFMDVPEHPLANHIVLLLYPEVTINSRGEYQACCFRDT